jgi:hypothetical protein
LWYQLDSRIHQKFEVLKISQALGISINETVGALVRLWSLSITQFPEGKGHLVSGDLKVSINDLPSIMALENTAQEIFDALSECQWIEELDGIVVIPKWDLKIGQTILKLEKDSQRKKAGGKL